MTDKSCNMTDTAWVSTEYMCVIFNSKVFQFDVFIYSCNIELLKLSKIKIKIKITELGYLKIARNGTDIGPIT